MIGYRRKHPPNHPRPKPPQQLHQKTKNPPLNDFIEKAISAKFENPSTMPSPKLSEETRLYL